MGLGKTLRHLSRKCCRYSSLEKFEDAFDIAFTLYAKKRKRSRTNAKLSKVWATQQLVVALVFETSGLWANFGHPSNCLDYSVIKSNITDVAVDQVGMDV